MPAMPSRTLSSPLLRIQPGSVTPEPPVRRDVSTLLWSPTALGRYAGAVGLGVLLLTGSWFAIGGKADWADQRGWMSLSVAVTTAVWFGGILLLVAGRRRIGLRRIALLGDLPLAPQPASTPVATAVLSGAPSSEELVSADNLVRFHRADCPLAVGKGYASAPLAAHRDAGRLPCGVCLS